MNMDKTYRKLLLTIALSALDIGSAFFAKLPNNNPILTCAHYRRLAPPIAS
jgi:hypothetical protein